MSTSSNRRKSSLLTAATLELPERLKNEFSVDELQDMKEQFDTYDSSGDGSIDAEEFHAIMLSLEVNIPVEQLADLIDEVDDNHSGALEFPEFVQLVSNVRSGQSGILGRFLQNSKQSSVIRKELENLLENPVEGFSVELNGGVRKWLIHYSGPPETPYENGVFDIEANFGPEYPYEPPQMKFITRIYHINFVMMLNGHSSIHCILKHWAPSWKMRDVLLEVDKLTKKPELERMKEMYVKSPVATASQKGTTSRTFGLQCIGFYLHDYQRYLQTAREITRKFATPKNNSSRSIEKDAENSTLSAD